MKDVAGGRFRDVHRLREAGESGVSWGIVVAGVRGGLQQFPLWYLVKAEVYTTLGVVDKGMQSVLILVRAVLHWRSLAR